MLEQLYPSVTIRLKLVEEMVRYADKELAFRFPEEVLRGFFEYIQFALRCPEEACINKEKVEFPMETFKVLAGFAKTHTCLRSVIDMIIAILQVQGLIRTRFDDPSTVYFNEDLISDIYRILLSVFKDVLIKQAS